MGNYRLLGQMLISKGMITSDQLDTVTREGHCRGRRIGEALVALGYVTERDITECLAEQFDFEVVDPSTLSPHPFALRLLSPHVAISHKVLMLTCSSDSVECVMSDPLDFPTSDMITEIVGRRTSIKLAPPSALVAAIRRAYGMEADANVKSASAPRRASAPPKPPRDRDAILAQLAAVGEAINESVCVRVIPGGDPELESVEGAVR